LRPGEQAAAEAEALEGGHPKTEVVVEAEVMEKIFLWLPQTLFII
jgi:hypothetical protein